MTSIIYTLRSLFWAMALLLLIVFVFAVLLVEAVSDNVGRNPLPEEELDVVMKYYGSLPRTMLALFMSISGHSDAMLESPSGCPCEAEAVLAGRSASSLC